MLPLLGGLVVFVVLALLLVAERSFENGRRRRAPRSRLPGGPPREIDPTRDHPRLPR